MQAPRLLSTLAMICICCLACTAQDYTAMNGNWHLVGSWGLAPADPQVSLSIGVRGNEILATGNLSTRCPHSGLGAGLALQGHIAPDGTFLLTQGAPNRTTISGKIPGPESARWSGHYSFTTNTVHGECSSAGDFIATKFPLLRGIYSGALQLTDHSGDVVVSINLNQGEFAQLDSLFWVPLEATITLSDSGEFPADQFQSASFPTEKSKRVTAVPAEVGGQITGKLFVVAFSEKGSHLKLGGCFLDANGQTLQVTLAQENSKVVALGTLTRQ